ncbi:family 10 glycosylhydrolase [Oscillatoria sp. FACHB-1406]|uniref:glycoside hydrolase family 10 protein n=1 Tax=Oscillatoria sp. FACHB-1406 TaxID=2692846 RepID=UPI001F54BDF3|nr:family 10 glycosylhydrolase [Oscillatoria sp. FACHB-1406]
MSAVPKRLKLPFIFIGLTSFVLAFLHPLAAQSQMQLNDIQNHWAKDCIQQLASDGIISGYSDRTFRPDRPVTRAEFAAIVNKAFPNAPVVRAPMDFADVRSNFWARNAIAQAYKTNFLSGYPNARFQPEQNIPRVQALVSLVSGLSYAPALPVETTLARSFTDAAAIPNYAKSAIAAATEKRLTVNYPNVQQLNPNRLATRADVAAFVCQALGRQGVPTAYIVGEAPVAANKPELRGVWLTNIDSDVLFSQQKLTDAIARLDTLNFNTLYPTVWNWGYTLYPSAVAQRETGIRLDPAPGLQGRDMLKETVTQGHAKGMAVIPWFEFGFMAPADSELAKRHPDWLTQRRNGETVWLEGGVHERVWLNPLRPDVQQFLTDLVVEIVKNYDVDGIQFDDHFGYPSDFGYDNFTVELYKKEHNGQAPPEAFNDSDWVRWRADKITNYMKALFATVKNVRKNAIFSVSPNPQEFSLNSYLLDWQTWDNLGLIEELIVQVYRDDTARFAAELEHPSIQNAKKHIPVAIGVLSGLKGRFVPLEQIQRQVQIVRDRGLAGSSFFFYESLWNYAKETPQQRQTGFQQMFPAEVKRPNIYDGWKPST